MEWETVIGLEVHTQLSTQSKLFSGAATQFGAEPNTQACAVDLALPGTLPVVNKQAIEYAIMFGLAINAKINQHNVFERKNYFYPDLPKGYQTSQLAEPIVGEGGIEIQVGDNTKTVRIHHAHLEEDAGKSLHEDFSGASGIDLNRAGTPLIEIVSEPDMRSAAEAVAYLKKLHGIVTSLHISDGDMSQGSFRCDANVSVRIKGEEKLGTRTELKNINSFKFVEKAIQVEAERQIDILESGGTITQETRLYDSDKNETRSMRSKEDANDYRYFPCPDLLPVTIEDALIATLRESLPELLDAKQQRFVSDYQLSEYDAAQVCSDAYTAQLFEEVAKLSQQNKLVANWITGEVNAWLNKSNLSIQHCPISAQQLADMIKRIADNTISSSGAKQVFEALWNQENDNVDAIIDARSLKQVSDTGALEAMVDEVVQANPEQVEQYKAADDNKRKKLKGFFVGPIMKASKGQANPKIINEILTKKLDEL